jgi:hypothetical protein
VPLCLESTVLSGHVRCQRSLVRRSLLAACGLQARGVWSVLVVVKFQKAQYGPTTPVGELWPSIPTKTLRLKKKGSPQVKLPGLGPARFSKRRVVSLE